MKSLYPTSFAEISEWASTNNVSVNEAKLRFAQYGVLRAIAGSEILSSSIVFKGGNALDFIWQPNRSTKDLDFSSINSDLSEEELKKSITLSLQLAGRETGIAFQLQRFKQNPSGPNKTFITYDIAIGYALPDDESSRKKIERGNSVSPVVPLEISINEIVCGVTTIDLQGIHSLQVSTPEDIVAEKLRALLQQQIRKRSRCQDMLDIAVILRNRELNRAAVADYLQRKAVARDVQVSLAAFQHEELRKQAQIGYAELEPTTRELFIPFEEAYQDVLTFVATLNLPET
jgi:predicted nucleotidyltransferase component of viral defense system